MYVNLKTRKWGNSMGVIIPKKISEKLHIHPGDNITLTIEKNQNPLKDLYGTITFTKPTKEILTKTGKDLEGTWITQT